jgi:hypothetical protein
VPPESQALPRALPLHGPKLCALPEQRATCCWPLTVLDAPVPVRVGALVVGVGNAVGPRLCRRNAHPLDRDGGGACAGAPSERQL